MGFNGGGGSGADNSTITLTGGGKLQALGVAPVGTISAWDKTLSGTPALPANWVQADGQTISDANSVYNGTAIRNLNGGRRFLAGNATSGGTGTQDFVPSHTHDFTHTHSRQVSNSITGAVDRMFSDAATLTANITVQNTSTTSAATSGTVWNFTNMVYIMRIY